MAFRLRGKKTATWTRTAENQIGPELFATDDPRTLPAFSDLNTKYVNLSTGNDGTGTGTFAAPYLTIQAGCNARKAAGGAFVYVVVSGTTSGLTAAESVDLKGAKLYTAADQTHTIQRATGVLATASAMPAGVTKVFCTLEAYGYFWAGTDDGIYTIASGGTGAWTLRAYDNKDIKRIVSHTDSKLYALNTEDKLVAVCVAPATVPGTWATAYNAAAWTDVQGLAASPWVNDNSVWLTGNAGATGYSIAYGLGTSWYTIGVEYGSDLGDIGCSTGRGYYATATGISRLDPVGFNAVQVVGATATAVIQVIGGDDTLSQVLFLSASKVYSITNSRSTSIPTITQLYDKTTVSSWTADATAIGYVDGVLYIGMLNKVISTADNGATWTSYVIVGTPRWFAGASKGVYVSADTGGLLKEAPGAVYDTDASATINGFTVDGNAGRGLYIDGAVTVEYCRCTNATQALMLSGSSADGVSIINSVFDTSQDGIYMDGIVTTARNWLNCVVHDCSRYGLYSSAICGITFYNFTVTRCLYGFYWPAGFYSGSGSSAEGCIVYGNYTADTWFPVGDSERFARSCVGKYLGVAPRASDTITANPLFRSTTDFNLQDKAGGYAIDSLCIGIDYGGVDIGAYDVTRSVSYAFGEDFTFLVPPSELSRAHQVSGFSFIEDVDGNYSEYFNGLRRAWTLSWADQTVCTGWETQADYFAYLQSLEDVAFEWGEYVDSAWVPEASGAGTVSGSTISVSENGVLWAANKYAGYWILVDSVYHRIASHPAKALNSAVVLTLDTAPTTGAQAWSIDYILVKLDKRSGINFKRIPSTLKAWAAYSITLREVDSYGV